VIVKYRMNQANVSKKTRLRSLRCHWPDVYLGQPRVVLRLRLKYTDSWSSFHTGGGTARCFILCTCWLYNHTCKMSDLQLKIFGSLDVNFLSEPTVSSGTSLPAQNKICCYKKNKIYPTLPQQHAVLVRT